MENITNKLKRKYNTDYRKKFKNKLENIKDKKYLLEIYNIIIEDIGYNFSSNINGIFININIISDKCIEKLLKIIEINYNNLLCVNYNSSALNLYKLDDIEVLSELGHKLSNQEKNIIKRIKK